MTQPGPVLTAAFSGFRATPGSLRDLERELGHLDGSSGVDVHLAAAFSRKIRRLLEEVVCGGINVPSIREHGAPLHEQDAPRFIFGRLATIGNEETVALLRSLVVTHPKWGVEVVNTIRAIQGR